MYPFERLFFHLKRKVKNKNKPEGAIVKQYVNEEITYFTNFYFEPHIKTKAKSSSRYGDEDEMMFQFNQVDGCDIPAIFNQIGRLSGKSKERWLSVEEWRHAHTYVLLNCDEIRPIERVFDEETKRLNPDMSDEECIDLKESSFAAWLQNYVSHSSENFPIWIQDLIRGPSRMVKCWPIMFTRGYTFHTYAHDSDRKTSNYGICVKGANCCDVADEPDFYGILQDIMVLEYHGYIGLKMVIFNCDWFDPTIGRGMRRNGSGGFDINLSKKYSKYDPFILSSQADQVCYISYPTSKRRRDHWRAVIKIQPRGVVREEEGSTDIPFQERRIDDDIGQQFRITYSQNEQLVVSNEEDVEYDNLVDDERNDDIEDEEEVEVTTDEDSD
ncbi:PREDICTED: uncharacterized protein LOC104815415 [Tarenaya hassleriana]|uniref:uncharacterized protein LOC104815415 n=1 Tax=Tarenaya hassleriana TaxID=28532 RepID=UPI00053C729B|nr:PREDICTED: uncharacterized protein LOC104815415 [Tarenaya hassleriana]